MQFIASPHGMTNALSTTERFVVLDEIDFDYIVAAMNLASLMSHQIVDPKDIDGNPVGDRYLSESINRGHASLNRARWMQLVIS